MSEIKIAKDWTEFVKLTGLIQDDSKLLGLGIEFDEHSLQDDGSIETWELDKLVSFVEANPDYKIISYTEDDNNTPMYSNEVHWVNRIKYYLGYKGIDAVVDFVDDGFAEMKAEYEAGNLDPNEDEEDCDHNDIDMDDRICLDCNKDMTEDLAAAAEAHYEGDR